MSDKITVKIKKLHPDAVIPQYAHKGDAGFDLVAVEDVIIEPGETKAISLGLAFEIPEGYEMQIRPRSGISSKTKLRVANAPATIDSGFRGEVKVILENAVSGFVPFVDYVEGLISGNYLVMDDGVIGETEVGADFFANRPCVPYLIRKGDRIAQGVIQRLPDVEIVETDELTDSERGTGGFGSSGVKA
jgi:dUTP pyrophosphatase